MDNKERLNKAFEYLKYKGIIKKQTDVADRMGSTGSNISAALSGNPKVLTESFLVRFHRAFEGVFSLTWLLTGEGDMLMKSGTQPADPVPPSSMSDTLAAKQETIELLKQQLEKKDKLIEQLMEDLRKLRYENNNYKTFDVDNELLNFVHDGK